MDKAIFYDSFGRNRDSSLCEKRLCRAVHKSRHRKLPAFVPHEDWWVLVLLRGSEALVLGCSPLTLTICNAEITYILFFFYRTFRHGKLVINIFIAR